VTLPAAVRSAVEAAIEEWTGRAGGIEGVAAVGGGCISPTARISTVAGDTFFLKLGGPDLPADMLHAEARGLRELGAAGELRVPDVVGVGGTGGGAWLLLEWLNPGGARAGTWEELGRGLAALHGHEGAGFGADADNYIGSMPQANAWDDGWARFWRGRRLEPQLRHATDGGLIGEADRRRFDALFARLDDLLTSAAAADGPSLLHGDLWSGNVHITDSGTAAVVDPSVYHGHREVDLAMTELFGGFDARFRQAYAEAWPLTEGYAPGRRAVYQLYYLLVHVNLFGASYLAGTRRALAEAGV
jgi:protein-ribulosamine 3-kinase